MVLFLALCLPLRYPSYIGQMMSNMMQQMSAVSIVMLASLLCPYVLSVRSVCSTSSLSVLAISALYLSDDVQHDAANECGGHCRYGRTHGRSNDCGAGGAGEEVHVKSTPRETGDNGT